MAVIAPHDFLNLMKDDGNPQAFPIGGDGNWLGFNMGGNENRLASNGRCSNREAALAFNTMVGDPNPLGSNYTECNANSLVSNCVGGGTGLGFRMSCKSGKPVVGGNHGNGKPVVGGNHGNRKPVVGGNYNHGNGKPVVGGNYNHGKPVVGGTGTGTGAGGTLMEFHMVCDAKMLVVQKGGDGKPLAIQVAGQKVDVNQNVEIGLYNPKGIEIGEWAVLLHNRRGRTNLQFVSIEGGWKGQVFAGMLYWLAITVKDKDDNNQIKNYEATVVDKPGRKVRVLLRFQLL